jgi:hypothetical protein
LQDIIGLLSKDFVVTEAMFKKVFLPVNATVDVQPPLPISDYFRKSGDIWKTEQKVNMVGHQNGKMAKPVLLFVIKSD